MLIKNVEEKKRRSWFHSCTGLAEISKSDFFWFPTYIHAYHTLRYDITHKHTQTQMYRHRHAHTHTVTHTSTQRHTDTDTQRQTLTQRDTHANTPAYPWVTLAGFPNPHSRYTLPDVQLLPILMYPSRWFLSRHRKV